MRISLQMRADIIQAALAKAGITAEDDQLAARRAEWAEKARRSLVTEDLEWQVNVLCTKAREMDKDQLSLVNVQPNRQPEIVCNVAGQRREFRYNGHLSGSHKRVYKLTPAKHPTFTADNPMVAELYDIDAAQQRLSERKAEVRAAVGAYLEKATTVKKLLDLWPEAAALIPSPPAAAPSTELALSVDELNKLVNLP